MTTLKLPLRWFGNYELALGQEFEVVAKVRVTALEEKAIDVTAFGSSNDETVPGESYATLRVMDVRVPLSEMERWPNPGSGAPCS